MKDYDSTLTRMAGNIAAGFVSEPDALNSALKSGTRCDDIAYASLSIAYRIITLAKEQFKTEQKVATRGAVCSDMDELGHNV